MKYTLENLTKLTEWYNSRRPELTVEIDHPSGYKFLVVVDNTALPSYFNKNLHFGKGGTRYTNDVNIDETTMLAKRMTLKNALPGERGLYGGAKSAIQAPSKIKVKTGDMPSDYIISCFADETWRYHVLGPGNGKWGGPGCDMNFNESCIKKYIDFLIEDGKTAYDINGIAGKGVAMMVKTVLDFVYENKNEFPNFPIKDSYSIAIQGLGAMGKPIFKRLTDLGHKVVAVSDLIFNATLVDKNGLDYSKIIEVLRSESSDIYEEVEIRPLDDILYLDCDILIPAAIGNVISSKNVDKIKASLIVEAANFPITEEAREDLHRKKVLVIPGESANFGGSVAASVELDPKVKRENTVKESLERTDKFIIKHGNFLLNKFLSFGGFNGISPYLITNGTSLERIVKAMIERGDIVPDDIKKIILD
ncbi:Glu/Leu/Phe/Val dehydrogenase [Candidatus Woesearchaeota archaeon]|nr:Glu/Leu/Phe/Val dehydrogenase [Candidatus Woesearchaeota archaeon]